MSTPRANRQRDRALPATRPHTVMVRLSDEELAEVVAQQAALQATELRSVSRAEVIRRRAWNQLPALTAA